MNLGGVVDDLIERQQAEVDGHDFDHRPESEHRRADGRADEALFGDGRVHDAVGAELLQQTGGNLVRALEPADLFAEQDDQRIAAHFFGERVVQGLAIGDYTHGTWPGRAAGWLATWVA